MPRRGMAGALYCNCPIFSSTVSCETRSPARSATGISGLRKPPSGAWAIAGNEQAASNSRQQKENIKRIEINFWAVGKQRRADPQNPGWVFKKSQINAIWKADKKMPAAESDRPLPCTGGFVAEVAVTIRRTPLFCGAEAFFFIFKACCLVSDRIFVVELKLTKKPFITEKKPFCTPSWDQVFSTALRWPGSCHGFLLLPMV